MVAVSVMIIIAELVQLCASFFGYPLSTGRLLLPPPRADIICQNPGTLLVQGHRMIMSVKVWATVVDYFSVAMEKLSRLSW